MFLFKKNQFRITVSSVMQGRMLAWARGGQSPTKCQYCPPKRDDPSKFKIN